MIRRVSILVLAALTAGAQADDGKAIRILIITGYHHPAHQWRKSTPALRHALEKDERCRVRVVDG